MSDRVVIDFDLHSLEYNNRGVETETELRSQCPVAWSEHHGGHWFVTGHDAVGAGLRGKGNCSTAKKYDDEGNVTGGVQIPTRPGYRVIPQEVDPPLWDDYRKLVSRPFAPRAVEELKPVIESYADEVLDHVIGRGEADFVMDVSSPITALITLHILGLPLEDWRFYAEPIHRMFTAAEGEDIQTGLAIIQNHLLTTIAERRENPREGLVDDLIASQVKDEPVPDEDIKDMLFNILVGGFDTTAGLLSGALLWLDSHRDVHQRLIEDDGYLRTATEEFLRYISPAVALGKTAAQDFELEGQEIKEGDRLWFMYRAANHDPAEFDDPEQVDLERSPNRHLAFSNGIHRCLGSNLARSIFQIVLRKVLIRMPDFSVDEASSIRYRRGAVNAGYAHMPIRFTPGEPLSDERIVEKI